MYTVAVYVVHCERTVFLVRVNYVCFASVDAFVAAAAAVVVVSISFIFSIGGYTHFFCH